MKKKEKKKYIKPKVTKVVLDNIITLVMMSHPIHPPHPPPHKPPKGAFDNPFDKNEIFI
jgi:hypothetical protein